jgi:hypothetical protein
MYENRITKPIKIVLTGEGRVKGMLFLELSPLAGARFSLSLLGYYWT